MGGNRCNTELKFIGRGITIFIFKKCYFLLGQNSCLVIQKYLPRNKASFLKLPNLQLPARLATPPTPRLGWVCPSHSHSDGSKAKVQGYTTTVRQEVPVELTVTARQDNTRKALLQ
jgi:hypothetical protein